MKCQELQPAVHVYYWMYFMWTYIISYLFQLSVAYVTLENHNHSNFSVQHSKSFISDIEYSEDIQYFKIFTLTKMEDNQ